MLITLFTDASFHRALGRGTWAMWAKGPAAAGAGKLTLRKSGILRSTLSQSGDAELCAIANGLYFTCRTWSLAAGDKIILQTDSTEAILAIQAGNHIRPVAQDAIRTIQKFWTAGNFRVEFRHVKGHRGNATPRNAVNTWCDGECRRQMGKLLKDLGVKQIHNPQTNQTDFVPACAALPAAADEDAEADFLEQRFNPPEVQVP